jgi:hypothetical protein
MMVMRRRRMTMSTATTTMTLNPHLPPRATQVTSLTELTQQVLSRLSAVETQLQVVSASGFTANGSAAAGGMDDSGGDPAIRMKADLRQLLQRGQYGEAMEMVRSLEFSVLCMRQKLIRRAIIPDKHRNLAVVVMLAGRGG